MDYNNTVNTSEVNMSKKEEEMTMKCPRCGHEMTLDTHRKYALNMCYECGYIEGRLNDGPGNGASNYARLRTMNFNEAVAFISGGLGLEEEKVADWLDNKE